jgi:hypothetical protein
VVKPENVAEAHAARISAKRLRYLLEPLARRAPGVKALVGRLKQLQDLLGNFHDMQVLAEEIDASLAALSRSMSDRQLVVRPGLLALQRLANEQAGESFAGFHAGWADGRAARFLGRANDLGSQLTGSAQATERKVVLTGQGGGGALISLIEGEGDPIPKEQPGSVV